MSRVRLTWVLSLACVVGLSGSFAEAGPITLLEDDRFVRTQFNAPFGIPVTHRPELFAPFDFRSDFGNADQVSTVDEWGFRAEGQVFTNDFDQRHESRFSVDFIADVDALFLLESFVLGFGGLNSTGGTGFVQLRDLDFGANVQLFLDDGIHHEVTGTLAAGTRYRLLSQAAADSRFEEYYDDPQVRGLFHLEFLLFDPVAAVAFGPMGTQMSLLGGSREIGGLNISLGPSSGQGVLNATFGILAVEDLAALYSELSFTLPNDASTNVWNISGGERFDGDAEITFYYDASLLPMGFDEGSLAVFHWADGVWQELASVIGAAGGSITVATSSFSPFVLGVTTIPEPTTALLLALGLTAMARMRPSQSR